MKVYDRERSIKLTFFCLKLRSYTFADNSESCSMVPCTATYIYFSSCVHLKREKIITQVKYLHFSTYKYTKLMTNKFTCIWAITSSYLLTERTETFCMVLGKAACLGLILCHRRKHVKLTKRLGRFQQLFTHCIPTCYWINILWLCYIINWQKKSWAWFSPLNWRHFCFPV